MFVRFREQKARRGSDYSLKVDIVQSYREGHGNPTHKTIGYISSYKVRDWKYKEREYCERERFWKKAEMVFKKLRLGTPSITAEEEAKVRAEVGLPKGKDLLFDRHYQRLRTGTPPQINADEEAKLRRELEARIPKPPPIPTPRVRGAALSWCNPKVWQKEPLSVNAYKAKP